MPNRLKYPRGLPHKGQRLYALVENLGFLFALITRLFFAIAVSFFIFAFSLFLPFPF